MTTKSGLIAVLAGWLACPAHGQWTGLFNGRNLDGWESIGDGVWSVMRDGTLLGQRAPAKAVGQAWLYTNREFEEFDLELEYWLPFGGNSGISIRDRSRARYACGGRFDRNRTPSHIGYEIQLSNSSGEKYPSGSVYLFTPARPGVQRNDDWNTLLVESRKDAIRVWLNRELVAEHPGDPSRSTVGPIGLQLYGKTGPVMFRRIRIREIKTP